MSTKEGSGAVASAMAMPVLCGGAGLLAAALIAGMASLLPPTRRRPRPNMRRRPGSRVAFVTCPRRAAEN